MAYVNVKDWSVDQVNDWIKGLDNVIVSYSTSFLNNGMTGHQLLNLRAEDLEHLGVKTLGHQEIILEAVEHLRNFHYELDKENLQMLALKVSCAANSLFKELLMLDDTAKLTNQIMTDVHTTIMAVKRLVCWLDRPPFDGDTDYIEKKQELLNSSIKMATIALRDIFSEEPIRSVRKICEQLAKITEYIIQSMSDPMILQPASLDLATLKKKQELGFFILPSNQAVHQICDIKYGYPAHGCNKIENGDEIVQVNYQTVVGWHRKNVMMLIQESPPEIVLTLKKRPRHTKVYGQIYMKPYRLPSRKRGGQNWSRWNENLPSPRLMPIHDLPPLNIPAIPVEPDKPEDVVIVSSSDGEQEDSPLDNEGRIYTSKPRPILQRRNTITGATPTSKRPYFPIEYWEQYRPNTATTQSSCNIDFVVQLEDDFLREKSVSCNVGLDKRPTTVLGISSASFKKPSKNGFKHKKVNFEPLPPNLVVPSTNLDEEKSISANSLSSTKNEPINYIDEGRDLQDRTNMTSDWKRDIVEELIDSINVNKMKAPVVEAVNENVGSIKDIIKRFDTKLEKPKVLPRSQIKKPPEVPLKPKPAVPPRAATTKLRGKLDKSHSTPAYDLTEDEDKEKDSLVLNKLPDVVPNVQDLEPFSETKYELGIPIVSTQSEVSLEEVKSEDFLPEALDVPPKPPPRNLDVPKPPAYPADSPKPKNLQLSSSKQQTFDFPDTQQEYNSPIQQTGTLMGKLTYEDPRAKFFEPKIASTPVVYTKIKMDFNEGDIAKYEKQDKLEEKVVEKKVELKSPNYEVQKTYEVHKSPNNELQKVSPTNSIVKAMISSGKGGKAKKKNTLTAKRRKVSVNDLLPCDIQGYLYQRLRGRHNQTNVHWEKRWFVLLGNYLYGYKNKDDPRAACLIFLAGYTVAMAQEVKSRSNAFKVYHTGTVFYFSSEDSEALQLWTDLIRQATLHNEPISGSGGTKSGNLVVDHALYSETDDSDSEKNTKNTSGNEKNDSLKKFGSLKKFTAKKQTDSNQSGSTSLDRKWFFHKSSSSTKNPIPVPTAQFRSYRKIRNDDEEKSVTTGNFTSHVSLFSTSSSNLPQIHQNSLSTESVKSQEPLRSKSKNLPINYIHASNPSLFNLADYAPTNFPKKSYNNKASPDSFQGCMTLEELMVKENEQRKLNPHVIAEEVAMNLNLIKPDVVYGVLPMRDEEPIEEPTHSRQSSADKHDTSCFGKRLGSLKKSHKEPVILDDAKMSTFPKQQDNKAVNKQQRSLPRQHKMPQTDAKFRERSYEMIYCPETTNNEVHFAQNRTLDDLMYQDTPKKGAKLKKQHSFNAGDKKTKSEGASGKSKLKSAIQYTPISIALIPDGKSKPKLAFELNLDEKSGKNSQSGKFTKILGSKSAEVKKEKTFFGSPKLHRAIFKKNDSRSDLEWPNSSPIAMSQSAYSLESSPPTFPEPSPVNISPQADYPGLQYPPVFEAETYSLADPQSLTLLRKNQ